MHLESQNQAILVSEPGGSCVRFQSTEELMAKKKSLAHAPESCSYSSVAKSDFSLYDVFGTGASPIDLAGYVSLEDSASQELLKAEKGKNV